VALAREATIEHETELGNGNADVGIEPITVPKMLGNSAFTQSMETDVRFARTVRTPSDWSEEHSGPLVTSSANVQLAFVGKLNFKSRLVMEDADEKDFSTRTRDKPRQET
jgi:hypothetical protein